MSKPLVPVSVGELIDKITILRIKNSKITDSSKLVNISNELKELENVRYALDIGDVSDLEEELYIVNTKLWDIEDSIRVFESKNLFNSEFVELARNVYKVNDIRSQIKRSINDRCGSYLIEEKFFTIDKK
jgi:hypothetical protein